MSTTGSLTKFYGSFFLGCADLAVCPYTLTLGAFLDQNKPKPEQLVLGVVACVVLSVVVPILPTITSLTFAIAMFAASLALASMFVAYPIALLVDALDSISPHDYQLVF